MLLAHFNASTADAELCGDLGNLLSGFLLLCIQSFDWDSQLTSVGGHKVSFGGWLSIEQLQEAFKSLTEVCHAMHPALSHWIPHTPLKNARRLSRRQQAAEECVQSACNLTAINWPQLGILNEDTDIAGPKLDKASCESQAKLDYRTVALGSSYKANCQSHAKLDYRAAA